MNYFCDLLVEARVTAGLTQIALAKKIGVVPTVLQKWEYGQFLPKALEILKIIKILNLDKNEVIASIENQKKKDSQIL